MTAVSAKLVTWSGSLHQTFRLLPASTRSPNLSRFLESGGLTPGEVLEKLPYHAARAGGGGGSGTTPDPKRYRDGRQVYQTVGLLFEADDGRVRLTDLGEATRRWLPILTPKNSILLARHAAYALSACQLVNPTGAGGRYDADLRVFPFQFIWRAMLALGGRISSDELNRAMFKVRDDDELWGAIDLIREARSKDDTAPLGAEVITGEANHDRIIPWMSLASFGWTLFPDKRTGEYSTHYEITPSTRNILREAARIKHRHRTFASVGDYVKYVSRAGGLPRDLR